MDKQAALGRIRYLVTEIQKEDGSSENSKQRRRNYMQMLMKLLSEHPFDLYQFSENTQKQITDIVRTYLDTCFGDGRISGWG